MNQQLQYTRLHQTANLSKRSIRTIRMVFLGCGTVCTRLLSERGLPSKCLPHFSRHGVRKSAEPAKMGCKNQTVSTPGTQT